MDSPTSLRRRALAAGMRPCAFFIIPYATHSGRRSRTPLTVKNASTAGQLPASFDRSLGSCSRGVGSGEKERARESVCMWMCKGFVHSHQTRVRITEDKICHRSSMRRDRGAHLEPELEDAVRVKDGREARAQLLGVLRPQGDEVKQEHGVVEANLFSDLDSGGGGRGRDGFAGRGC